MKRAILILAFLGLLGGGFQGQATADETPQYALVAIRNTTNVTITYYYWWGHTSWNRGGSDAAGEVQLAPGAYHYYAWKYAPGEEGYSPPLNVFFNSYTPSRSVADGIPREYSLERTPAPAREYRYYKKYHFGLRADGRLDLFESR